MRYWILFFLLVQSIGMVIPVTIFGQENSFLVHQFRDKQGLPGRSVFSSYQQESGLIWLATEQGLARFDGNEFIHFPIYSYSQDIIGSLFYMDLKPNNHNELVIIHLSLIHI